MRINHNIAALNTHRQLGANNTQASKNLEKLSSGLKINRAGDDAAGLAISEKMRGQIRGLDMASKNAQDGISMIQTSEGALNETHSILQRMRELAVQAGNDTNADSDRTEIQKELNQLTSEINRISNTTEFNTKKLLNGGVEEISVKTNTLGRAAEAAVVGTASETTFDFSDLGTLSDGDTVSIGGKNYTFDTAGGGVTNFKDADELATLISADAGYNATNAAGTITLTQKTPAFDKTGPAVKDGSGASVATTVVTEGVSGKAAVTEVLGSYEFALDIKDLKEGQKVKVGTAELTFGTDFKNLTELATAVTAAGEFTASAANGKVTLTQVAGNGSATVPSVGVVNTDGGFKATLQIGANKNQTMQLDINSMSAKALKLTSDEVKVGLEVTNGTNNNVTGSALDVSNHEGAANAVKVINNAIETVSAERSKLGAFQNRLEHTINNLGTSSENLTAAESRIRDVDMAKEMMEFTKNNILTQAAQAMLAQANQQPQGVLQLLR